MYKYDIKLYWAVYYCRLFLILNSSNVEKKNLYGKYPLNKYIYVMGNNNNMYSTLSNIIIISTVIIYSLNANDAITEGGGVGE